MSNKLMEENGVTLVEVLISMVILLLVFTGLIQASLLAIGTNARNLARDEAVRVAAEYMTETRALPFMHADLTAPNPNPGGCAAADWNDYASTVPTALPANAVRNFRNLTVTYNVDRCVSDLDTENKQVGIRVRWTDARSGEALTHTILTNVRNK